MQSKEQLSAHSIEEITKKMQEHNSEVKKNKHIENIRKEMDINAHGYPKHYTSIQNIILPLKE